MRIHLNTSHPVNVVGKAVRYGTFAIAEPVTLHRSQTHRQAITVYLSGNAARRARMGRAAYRGATWDEWGVFLANVFSQDPTARTGDYMSAEHFHWATNNRFANLTMPADTHRQHRWRLTGAVATNTYYVYECDRCDAIMRRPAGLTPAERRANLATILNN